jgi:hypothetical protein
LSNTNWINNSGLTKETAWKIKKFYHEVLRSVGKNKFTWMTEARVNNINLKFDEYTSHDQKTILKIRDNRILDYFDNLLK